MLSEFKKFVLRGNVVDLAVAVVVGVAFTAMITAFVADLITPLIAAILLALLPDRRYEEVLSRLAASNAAAAGASDSARKLR